MRAFLLLTLLALVSQSYADVPAYGQCGGHGYAGQITCVSGYYCSVASYYYSQCLPGTAPVSTTSAGVSTSQTSTVATPTGVKSCTTAFKPVTAAVAFAGLNPGWNLGNGLDSIPDESSWNNAPVQASTFTAIAAKKFKGVRIPVTWAYHFTTTSPTWNVNTTWLDRVETVVDQALAAGFYVVLNAHHDSWVWADVTVGGANLTAIEERFSRLWFQIGTRFACKSSKLIFEAINEPVGDTEVHATELNKLNDIFLDQINKAGGYNPQRVVSLSGLGQDSIKTSRWFSRGTTYPSQPWGLQFHYYSPYDFIFSAWGKTIWGSDADKASILNDFTLFNGNFTTIPAFVGEWDASPANTETAARWKYFDYFIRTANKFKYSTILWDNGNDHYNRAANTWSDEIAISTLFSAAAGATNSLADSTTDASATSQSSSATLFHKVGDPVVAQSVSYILNGNTLTAIKNSAGTALTSSQYSISSAGVVTFTASYLGSLFTYAAAAGIKATLTLTFSAGTPLTLQIIQYDTPTIPTTSYSLSSTGITSDLYIPVTYKGLPKIAAVRAIEADGTYLADTWTVWLGPLQQARWTRGGWGYDTTGLILYTGGLSTLKATGQTVTLLVEFFPRSVGANAVNVTITQ